MKFPTVRFVFDRKKVATKKKKGLVQIEVCSERKRQWIGTTVKVYSDQWDDRLKVINSNDSIQLNLMLDMQIGRINDFIFDLMRNNQSFDFEKLKSFLENKYISISYIDFVIERVNNRKDIEESTRRQHRTLIHSLKSFGKINKMDDITKLNIVLYDEYLHEQGISQATIHNYHKRNKIYINDAIKFDLIKENPYKLLSFSRGKSSKRRYLTEEEILKMTTCKISNPAIDRVRDLFLLQCYTGLAFVDLEKIDFKKDIEIRNGKHVIVDRRKKTDEDYYIVLLSPALQILNKYDFCLPIISNQKYNAMLKVAAQYANIDKEITTHVARHTFAVFALNNGVSMEVVSKMLGHSSIRTTQVYAKIINREVERGFDLLESKIT